MVLPQFSIKTLIGITAGVAVMALIASWGGQGTAWAIGATIAVIMVVFTLLIHASLFGLMWLLAPIVDKSAKAARSTVKPSNIVAPSMPPSAANDPAAKD